MSTYRQQFYFIQLELVDTAFECRSQQRTRIHSPGSKSTVADHTFYIQYERPWHRCTNLSGQSVCFEWSSGLQYGQGYQQ